MSQRKIRSFDDDQIDLEELAGGNAKPLPTVEEQETVKKVAEQSHFISREVQQKKARKRTPYVIQKNMKMRIGMPELLAEITKRIKSGSDQETIEIALGALVEREGAKGLISKFEKLTKDS